jgi:phosphoglycolate phosphatase
VSRPGTVGPISLVCFDMAGTTVSDAGSVEDAFGVAMSGEGIEAGDPRYDSALEYVRSTMGQSKIAVFTHLFGGDPEVAQRANSTFERAYRSFIDEGRVEPMKGAESLFDDLRSQEVGVCLTTGFSPATRDAILAALDWGDRVDLVLSPADSGRGRPYPDMILTAVLRLAIDDVAQVAVVGDTASDLLAGWRAGAGIVAGVLTGAHQRADLEAVPHTHILNSITDLPGALPARRPT